MLNRRNYPMERLETHETKTHTLIEKINTLKSMEDNKNDQTID